MLCSKAFSNVCSVWLLICNGLRSPKCSGTDVIKLHNVFFCCFHSEHISDFNSRIIPHCIGLQLGQCVCVVLPFGTNNKKIPSKNAQRYPSHELANHCLCKACLWGSHQGSWLESSWCRARLFCLSVRSRRSPLDKMQADCSYGSYSYLGNRDAVLTQEASVILCWEKSLPLTSVEQRITINLHRVTLNSRCCFVWKS